ncbi:MAG: TPR repeat protein, partial [Halioglobus sp.]
MTLRSYFSTIVFCCVFTCSVAHASSDLIVPKNISEFEELTVAAENGDSEAQRNVGFLYRNGCQEIGLEV